eukprot:TRINITY_DN7145_c1_g1_i2.p1 TRINITY_DN7145_c1_g1~~TRINITY_DN7145_c1_g1_i2.p1  ORF type:complete len:213 (+),score=37.73 TRINITY_DN7145_c1_g1_i2:279-917(+)
MGCSDSKSTGSSPSKKDVGASPKLLDTTNGEAIKRAQLREKVEKEGERLATEAEVKLLANERAGHTRALLLQSCYLDPGKISQLLPEPRQEEQQEDDEVSSLLYSARTSHLNFVPPSEISSCVLFANLPTCASDCSTATHESTLIDSTDSRFIPYVCHDKPIQLAEDGEHYKNWFRSIRNSKSFPLEPEFGDYASTVGGSDGTSAESTPRPL